MSAYIYYEGGVVGETPRDVRLNGDPLKVDIGARRVIPGIEEALCDMEEGETRTVLIEPDKGYGQRDPDGVQTYPRAMLGQVNRYVQMGDVLTWTNPTTHENIPVCVIGSTPETVTIDFNHPFAGKTLEYRITLVKLSGKPPCIA